MLAGFPRYRSRIPYQTSRWDPFAEVSQLQRAMNHLFDTVSSGDISSEFPAVNMYSNDDEVLLTAELPGVEPKDMELSVHGNTLTLKVTRRPEELKEGEAFHRRERGRGVFTRSIELPYSVEQEKARASLKKGLLRITLPRAESDRPRKIAIEST